MKCSYQKSKQIQTKGHKETLGGGGCIYYLDCSDGIRVFVSKIIRLYIVDMCSFCILIVPQ